MLLVVDTAAPPEPPPDLPAGVTVDILRNKIDVSGEPAGAEDTDTGTVLRVSARTGAGMDALRAHLRRVLDGGADGGGTFSARRRHLDALDRAASEVEAAAAALDEAGAGELAAEHLRRAGDALGAITGAVATEDLLGEIFSRFCIGK